MRVLFLGDIVGRAGRDAVVAQLPLLRKQHAIDLAIVNADNAAAGFGTTPDICQELMAAGADVITCGDHAWDQKNLPAYMAQQPRVLRPHNFPSSVAGSGLLHARLSDGREFVVLHLLGQVFHKESAHCPFAVAKEALQPFLRTNQMIIVDMHAEATSEKNAMGVYLDGRVSAVMGSHTHVATADARILPNGTAYQTDAGMCGVLDSIIGFDPAAPLERFLTKIPKARMEPAKGQAIVQGCVVVTDDKTGAATSVTRIGN